MKKLICSLLTMAILVGHMPIMYGYASENVENEYQYVVNAYMDIRSANMLENVVENDWSNIVVQGIIEDENSYVTNLKEAGIVILKTDYEIVSTTGEEIVNVIIEETLTVQDVRGTNDVEVVHNICAVKMDNEEYIVVSDEYYDANIGFASCSYVDETTMIETCSFGGSPLCITHIANSEVGYCEKQTNEDLDDKTANAGNGNYTKYGEWYGLNGQAWCAMFVSWCANQASISTGIIPKFALTESGMQTFQSWGKFENSVQYGGSYTPKVGDIFFLSYDANDTYHTGIVVSVSGNTMTCIEGNTENNMVEIKTRSLTSSSLRGFGTPSYPRSEHLWETSSYINRCSICGYTETAGVN